MWNNVIEWSNEHNTDYGLSYGFNARNFVQHIGSVVMNFDLNKQRCYVATMSSLDISNTWWINVHSFVHSDEQRATCYSL